MVSIIILTFNNLRYSKQCIESLYAHTEIGDFELIIIDNGSTDGTKEWIGEIANKHNNITYVINSQNRNFAVGCNQGAGLAKREFLLFLNNDTILTPNWLRPMLDCFSRDTNIGVVGNKHLFPNSDTVWHCGGVIGDDKVPKHIYIGHTSKSPMVNISREYIYITGACLVIKKDMFNKIDGFDCKLVNSYEDVDLCLKIRKLGYKIYYCSESFIYHYGSISDGRFQFDKSNVKRLLDTWDDELIPDEKKYFMSDNFPACLSNENKADIFIHSIQKELSSAIDILQSPKKLSKLLISRIVKKIMILIHQLS